MKKISGLALAFLILSGGLAIAERSTFIGVGYAQNANTFTDTASAKSLLTNGIALSIDTFQSPGELPFGFTGSIVATMPKQMDISLDSVAQTPLTNLEYGYAVDSCFGIGYHLKLGLPITFYAGLGVALDIVAVSNADDAFFGINYGVGGTVSARFDFTRGFGLVATVRDNFCPWSLMWLSSAVGTDYTYANANNFSASIGLALGY